MARQVAMVPGAPPLSLLQGLSSFVAASSPAYLGRETLRDLKMRILDSLGCAIGAQSAEVVRAVRAQVENFGGRPVASLIGGGQTSPAHAALYNGALIRYLDFNDSYLAAGETSHPSDCLGAVLAAAEYRNAGGDELLTALAVAYEVQCRLSDVAPVRHRGFDHTTLVAYAAAAGVARALALDEQHTANAIAIAGTALNALRVTRTDALSHWKGLAAPFAAFGATWAAFLAARGITGPPGVLDGRKGFAESIAGPFHIDWSTGKLDSVRLTAVKKFNAEVHAQSAIEALIELSSEHRLAPDDILSVDIATFDVAYNIIGGGDDGCKTVVKTKEDADHSLPYLAAVALLDGRVLPKQFDPSRIVSEDVQSLLSRVTVYAKPDFTRRFPKEHCCRVRVHLRNGSFLECSKQDYEGMPSRPMSWAAVEEKFEGLADPVASPNLRSELIDAVRHLEHIKTSELTSLLSRVRTN